MATMVMKWRYMVFAVVVWNIVIMPTVVPTPQLVCRLLSSQGTLWNELSLPLAFQGDVRGVQGFALNK